MFGDVNPPHVLLVQFYAAEQGAKMSSTEWYARLEDIVSKITRKDVSIISPDNYDIVVNTQFWTQLCSSKIKDALRHKFDALAGSPNFIVKARKTVKVQQADAEMSPMFQKGFDEILARLTALETKFSQVTPSSTSAASTPSQPTQQIQRESRPQGSGTGSKKTVRCFKCDKLGHIAKNCRLNFKGSKNKGAV